MRLTIIPPVIDGESAAAHLLRAFDVNGEPWSRERLRTAGHSMSDILQGRAAGPSRIGSAVARTRSGVGRPPRSPRKRS
ncbi:hypothetical protein [Methylobacterium tardum]|uniref:hypothetical protein n=1 Tax=Methylobacterium tardum TaxID=374432 RepID=UPI00360817BF